MQRSKQLYSFLPKPGEPLQHSARLVGNISTIEVKGCFKIIAMEEDSIKTNTDDEYMPSAFIQFQDAKPFFFLNVLPCNVYQSTLHCRLIVLKFVIKLPYLVAKIMNLFQDKYLSSMSIITTRNLPFCNCLMQLVFSYMRHLQLQIHPVA